MGDEHKGDKKDKWPDAVKSAADKADKAGEYTLTTEIIERPQAGGRPIRDYIVTLDGPR